MTAAPQTWHLLTGDYPPQPGGVADYTAVLAHALHAAGCEVHVWSAGDASGAIDADGVRVHRVAGRFGPRGLARLGRELDCFPGPRTILVQYVPHGFGWKAMNLPFAAWVLARRARCGDDTRVMFHEVAFPWVRRPLRHNLVAATTRIMAALLLRACTRAYVSIPGWVPILHRLGGRRVPITWTPVPANIPAYPSPAAVATHRMKLTGGSSDVRIVGHFGTYGAIITPSLAPALGAILSRRPDVRVLLLGAGGDRWRETWLRDHPDWADRVIATGSLPGEIVAEYLQVCDVVLQPYPDGASSRRTSLMAALANGVPVATTRGTLSEPIWSAGAVAAACAGQPGQLAQLALDLLDRPEKRRELGQAGRRLYEEQFAIGRTVAALLDRVRSRA
jgi:glycosyltransferase involved in cell wall biosynthesis